MAFWFDFVRPGAEKIMLALVVHSGNAVSCGHKHSANHDDKNVKL
jgi:hypothetical protein